jgi:hypothetical protein
MAGIPAPSSLRWLRMRYILVKAFLAWLLAVRSSLEDTPQVLAALCGDDLRAFIEFENLDGFLNAKHAKWADRRPRKSSLRDAAWAEMVAANPWHP